MRIIGGTLKGRRIPGPAGVTVRPTSDRVREAIASALAARGLIGGAEVLELFAGTGALSFEMLSRGASRALLLDNDRRLVRAMGEIARGLGLADRVLARVVDLSRAPRRVASDVASLLPAPATLVLCDPPYSEVERAVPLFRALLEAGAVSAGATLVLEHATRTPPGDVTGLAMVATYRYGDTGVVVATAPDGP